MNHEVHIVEDATEVPIQLYQLIDDFNTKVAKDPHVSSILHEGLSVFAHLKDTFFASVFLMNSQSFEFEHSSTLPRSMSGEAQRCYELLLNEGRVGAALSSGQVIAFHEDSADGPHYFLVPMVGMSGVMGLLLVSTSVSPSMIPNAKIKCYNYFVQMFAKTLENAEYLERNEKLEDILQQKVASRTIELVETKKELLDRMEDLKVNIATAIPHEIRTPINTILGSSAFMRDHLAELDRSDAHEMLSDIYGAAQRLQRLFENYQSYSRLSITATQAVELQRIRAEVTPSVQLFIETIARYRAMNVQRMEDLVLDVEEASVCIPEDLLRKVLDELVDNALKYSIPGQRVEVSAKKEENRYVLRVCDEGRGMMDEHIQNVQAYAQFERHTHEQQGLGLGLAIVQRIADIIEAELHISSGEQNKGLSVTLSMACPTAV